MREARAKLRRRLPTAIELVYDNYNALAIGFASSERASDVIVSLAVYARGVNLYFIYGVALADPHHLLLGSGNQGRFVRLESADDARPARDRCPGGRGNQGERHATAAERPRPARHQVGVAEAAAATGDEALENVSFTLLGSHFSVRVQFQVPFLVPFDSVWFGSRFVSGRFPVRCFLVPCSRGG